MVRKRLYYENPYLKEFSCIVTKCIGPVNLQDFSIPVYMIETDVTAFYPASGGQPADKGALGGLDVIGVIESEKGEVVHLTKSSLDEGQIVNGKIDFDRRFDHMQQHTGQHILSAAFARLFDIETQGFHLGEEVVTIDLDIKDLTEDQRAAAERMACDTVFHNHPVLTSFHTPEEANLMNSRKHFSGEGEVRIVQVEGFDTSMCCGTHVDSTGKVGLIKIIKTEKMKGMTRVEFLCGRRALKDYSAKNIILSEVSSMLSIHHTDLLQSIVKMQSQHKDMRKKIEALSSELLVYQADEMYQKAEVEPSSRVKLIVKIFDSVGFDSLKMTSSKVCQKLNVVTLFASKTENTVQFVFQRSENVALDANKILKGILALIDGKGGGSPMVAQGGAKDVASLESIMALATKKVEAELSGALLPEEN